MQTDRLVKHGMMHIDKLKNEYINAVYEIECACFKSPWSIDDLRAQLDKPTSHFIVAISDNRVVGYIGLQIFSGEGYVTNVAVLPEYRRQGIARALIHESLKNDMEFLTLEVRVSNTPAIKLYESMGFIEVGRRPKFYREPVEDALLYTIYRGKE